MQEEVSELMMIDEDDVDCNKFEKSGVKALHGGLCYSFYSWFDVIFVFFFKSWYFLGTIIQVVHILEF